MSSLNPSDPDHEVHRRTDSLLINKGFFNQNKLFTTSVGQCTIHCKFWVAVKCWVITWIFLIFTYLLLSQKSPFCGINKSTIGKKGGEGSWERGERAGRREVAGRGRRTEGGAFIKGTEITVQSLVFNRVTNNWGQSNSCTLSLKDIHKLEERKNTVIDLWSYGSKLHTKIP